MKYEIDSSSITFSGKGLKSFFIKINEACQACNNSYYVVGAFARDLILENIFNQPTGIATRDIDVAIAIDKWKNYNKFIEHLKSTHGFKNGKNVHEFISPEGVVTDILPYGKIEVDRKVNFPAHNKEINMIGFREIYNSTITINLDNAVEFKIASIEAIAILKFIAWKDRQPAAISEKHNRDIGLIINSYFDAMVSEFATEFSDLFDEDNFDSTICAARALGRRIKQIVNTSVRLKQELLSIFDYILKEEDNSLFITQLSNSSNWKYDFTLQVVNSLIKGFKEI